MRRLSCVMLLSTSIPFAKCAGAENRLFPWHLCPPNLGCQVGRRASRDFGLKPLQSLSCSALTVSPVSSPVRACIFWQVWEQGYKLLMHIQQSWAHFLSRNPQMAHVVMGSADGTETQFSATLCCADSSVSYRTANGSLVSAPTSLKRSTVDF